MVITIDIFHPKLPDIHGSDPIIIGCISTAITCIQMLVMITVGLPYASAFWTSLACIFGRYMDDLASCKMGLIRQKLFQLGKGPRYLLVPLIFSDFFCSRTDICQVFEHEQRVRTKMIGECLRQTMIYICHITVLSLPDLL